MRGNHKTLGKITLGLATWLVMEILLPGLSAYGQEGWTAAQRYFKAAEQAENCVVFRVLVRRADRDLKASQAALVRQIDLLKAQRERLEACARNKGLVSIVSDNDEALVAEICASDYASWLHLNYSMVATRQNISVATNSKTLLERQLSSSCLPIPKLRPELKVEPVKIRAIEAKVTLLPPYAIKD